MIIHPSDDHDDNHDHQKVGLDDHAGNDHSGISLSFIDLSSDHDNNHDHQSVDDDDHAVDDHSAVRCHSPQNVSKKKMDRLWIFAYSL